MSIVAKVERIGSQVVPGQKFIFRESGLDKYSMNFSGQIVGISFLTEAKVKPTVNINITIDNDGSEQNLPIRGLLGFGNSFSLGTPLKFTKGSKIIISTGVVSAGVESIQMIALIELFL